MKIPTGYQEPSTTDATRTVDMERIISGDYLIKETPGFFIVTVIDENLKEIGPLKKSTKDKGIWIQLGIKVGIKKIIYDKNIYTKKQIQNFLKKLKSTECPLCKKVEENIILNLGGNIYDSKTT